jgi:dolichol-phosphate mannosyltransferase
MSADSDVRAVEPVPPEGVSILLFGAPADAARPLATGDVPADVIAVSGREVSATVLRDALSRARHSLVAVVDCSCGPTDLARLLPLAKPGEIVIASRRPRISLSPRRLASLLPAALSRLLLGAPVGGLIVGTKSDLAAALPKTDGPLDRAEWLARSRRAGVEVTEVRLARPEPSVEVPAVVQSLRTATRLARFWWNDVLHAESGEPNRTDRRAFWLALAALVVLCGLLFYPNLSHPLVEPDEGRHAEIPREMLASGNWLVPHFNNDLYYDKPPLFYWLCAASYSVFGVSERAARLVPATATTLLALSLFVWGRRRFGTRPALLGAVVFALSPGVAFVGRFVVLDALLDLLVAGSLMLAFEAVRAGRLRWGWWLASAVCCGFGLLAKGPVSLALTVPPVAVFAWLERGAAPVKVRHWAVYGLVSVSIAAPWFAAVIARDPEYARYFFWDHNIGRFVAGANHPKPIWFYAPVLLVACLPWSLLFVPLVPFLFGRTERLRRLRPNGTGFLALWAGWIVLFFTVSSGKLPTYVLPAIPALSLLVGLYVDHLLFAAADLPLARLALRVVPRYGAAALCWAGLGATVALPLLGFTDWRMPMLAFWPACLVALGVTWWRIRPLPSYLALGVIALAALLDATHGHLPHWAASRSFFAVAGRLDDPLKDPAVPVACWGSEWGSVPFYLRRDDVTNFEHGALARAEQFLLAHDRAFLLLKGDFEVGEVTAHLPRGRTLTHLIDVGDQRYGAPGYVRLYLMEPAAPAPTPLAARWTELAAKDDTGKL